MAKLPYTHLVYLNNTVDPKIWSLYAPYCQEMPSANNDIKHYVLLCSKIDLSSISYLQVTAHFQQAETNNLKVPHAIVLLIREVSSEEKPPIGFFP